MRWKFKKGVPIIIESAHPSYLRCGRGCPAFPNKDAQETHILGLNGDGIEWDRIAEKVTFESYLAVGYSMLIGVSYFYDYTYTKRMRDSVAW